MSDLIAQLHTGGFWPLPSPNTAQGAPRKVGVEIEFAELSAEAAAAICQDIYGGSIDRENDHVFAVTGTEAGTFEIYLDTSFKDRTEGLPAALLDVASTVIPVEVVTPPLDPDSLPDLETLARALRDAGAKGSRDGLLYGFGLHLNPEVRSADLSRTIAVTRAYTLLEDWLRGADPIDTSRRLLPFTSPYPRAFADALAEAPDLDDDAFIDLYLAHNDSRNHGLDLLPLLTHIAPDRVKQAMPDDSATSARPTYHYRLPDCRIDEDQWSIAYEWNRWVVVERLAENADVLRGLSSRWRKYRAALTTTRSDWHDTIARTLADAGLVTP